MTKRELPSSVAGLVSFVPSDALPDRCDCLLTSSAVWTESRADLLSWFVVTGRDPDAHWLMLVKWVSHLLSFPRGVPLGTLPSADLSIEYLLYVADPSLPCAVAVCLHPV